MKKFVVTLILALLVFTGNAFAEDVLVAGDFQYTVSSGEAKITHYSGSEMDLTIPDSLDNHPVTIIGTGAFKNNKGLHSVTFPSTLEYLYSSAFYNCTQLTSVTMNEGLIAIGENAFTQSSIVSVTIPSTVENMDGFYLWREGSFYNASSLKEINFEPGANLNATVAFESCESLQKVVVSKRATVNEGMFQNCVNLERVVCEDGVEKLDTNIFKNCKKIEYLYLPQSVTQINDNIFGIDASKMQNLTIYGIKGSAAEKFCTDFDIPFVESSTPDLENKGAIYRLYNELSGEHLYTSNKEEYDILCRDHGWTGEGVGWYSPDSGDAVYRLYNPQLADHLYTTDTREVNTLTKSHGWQKDNDGKPLFYSGGDVPIYRLYMDGNGRHHLTKDKDEYDILGNNGWKKEGVALYGLR